MGRISKVIYKVTNVDPYEIARSYFYKSTLSFSDRYIEDLDRIEFTMLIERNKCLSELDNVNTEKINNSILGLSSIEDRIIFIV